MKIHTVAAVQVGAIAPTIVIITVAVKPMGHENNNIFQVHMTIEIKITHRDDSTRPADLYIIDAPVHILMSNIMPTYLNIILSSGIRQR